MLYYFRFDPDRSRLNSPRNDWGYSLTENEYKKNKRKSKLFFMCLINKCWSYISRLPIDMIDMKIFFYVFFICHYILVLDKFPSFFKNSLCSSQNMPNTRMWNTSKWKSRYNNIHRIFVYYRINMSSTYLVYLTLFSIFLR